MADLKISQLTGATTPLAGTEVLPIVQSNTTKKVSVSDLTAGRSISVSGLTNTGVTASSMAFFSSGQVLSGNATLTWNAGTQQMGFQNAAASAYAYIGTTGAGSNADLSVYMGATETIRFANAGSLVPKVAGQGVNFTANTPAAGMTSQLLNWYEEGTWTPVIRGSGTAGTYQLAVAYGRYTRVGNLVTLTAGITLDSSVTGGGTGDFQITGLPFAKAANTSCAGAVILSNIAFTGSPIISTLTRALSSTLYVATSTSGAGSAPLAISAAVANGAIDFTLNYTV